MKDKTVFVVWHGGAGYSASELPRDIESFESLTFARNALLNRYMSNGRYRETFRYVNRPHDEVYAPGVDLDSIFDVYLADPTNTDDAYPDWRYELRESRNGYRAYVVKVRV